MTRLGGLAAVLAGGTVAVLALARRYVAGLDEESPAWDYYYELLRLLFLPSLLGLVALHALYRLQPGPATRTGYALAGSGLAVAAATSAMLNAAERVTNLAVLLHLAGYTLAAVGLAVFGLASARSGRLPGWLRLVPAGLGALMLVPLATMTVPWLVTGQGGRTTGLLLAVGWSLAGGNGRPEAIGPATAAGWLLLGVGLLAFAPSVGDGAGQPTVGRRWPEVARALASRGTLISGALGALVWGLQLGWAIGALVVLLLYAHELGHVLFALWRGVPVRGAPIFLPGFGAFVRLGPQADVWDDVWTSLGGPIVGGVAALATKAAGQAWDLPALAVAGDFALAINVLNLAPLGPLDGGSVAARLGWLGSLITLPVAGLALYLGLGPIATLIALLGIWRAFSSARRGAAWSDRLSVLAVYLAVLATLTVAWLGSGRVRGPGIVLPDWAPGLEAVFAGGVALWLVSALAVQRAWRPGVGPRARYLLLALLGWPLFLLRQPSVVPVAAALGAASLGLPGLVWLRPLARREIRRGNRSVAAASTWAYDFLQGLGRPEEAAAWLTELEPDLRAGGGPALVGAYAELSGHGHRAAANGWLASALCDLDEAELSPIVANTVAWAQLVRGRPGRALAPARAAVAAEPDNASFLDTLGQVELALGDAPAAERHLRRSLERQERSATRVALARLLAGQGRRTEALGEAERALRERIGHWGADEPSEPEVRAWVEEWRAAD